MAMTPETRRRWDMHDRERAVLIDKQMTAGQMSARERREANVRRMRAMLAEHVDIERNLTGIAEAKRQLAHGRAHQTFRG